MIWPFKKKLWGGRVRIVEVRHGDTVTYHVEYKTRTRRHNLWKVIHIRYELKTAMEEAAAYFANMTIKRKVIAE